MINKKNVLWIVGTDDVGRPALRWTLDQDLTDSHAAGAHQLAETDDPLKQLEVDGLALQEEESPPDTSYDPYNTGIYSSRALRRFVDAVD